MQQVGIKGFADAQVVDPRQLPVPLSGLSRKARINVGAAWVLHRKLIVRGIAFGIVALAAVGAYEAREPLLQGVTALTSLAQGEAAKAGFGISKINITGQSLTAETTIVKALAIEPNVLTVSYDVDAALARLEAIPSVKSATIRKIYPDELQVMIDEKVPVARWRIGDTTYLVDETGSPVAPDDGTFRELPLVVGEGAADAAMVMIRALDRYPSITADLAALSRIGDRRWDLIFYSGLRVQLPENGVAQALVQLDMYEQENQLLERDVTVIDMRVDGMLSLKLGEVAQKAWDEDKKKTKRVIKYDSEYETPAERAAEATPQ